MSSQIERACVLATACMERSARTIRCRQFIAASIAISMLMATAHAQTKATFDIDAQPAAQSLNLYARQARVQLGFAEDQVGDVRTNSVKGEYESTQALELLLAGTGLEAEHGERGIIVRQTVQREMEGRDEAPTTKTAGLQFTQAPVQATTQDSTSTKARQSNEDSNQRDIPIEEILVTGSRIRGAGSASPVVTITRQDIERAGFATVEELIDKLPQNFGAGASHDRFTDLRSSSNVVGGNVGQLAGGTSINLRGLGASSTLVLINGRRPSPSGLGAQFVDVSSIPLTAIERVDVLTDGASAIYGADAIGGVVTVAAYLTVSPEVLGELRRRAALGGPVLRNDVSIAA